MPGVFINYRFADERFGAGILYDLLVERFGTNQVFRDCVSLQPGELYPTALRAGLEQADVLLAVIGPSWLSLSDHMGKRLLDRPEDWVRREIARALKRDIHVIPVLTDQAVPPTAADLPADMRGLALRQAHRISHGHFSANAEKLIARITALAPELVTTELFTPAQLLPSEFLPSELLRAEHALVPFTGRRQELTELRSWTTDSPQLSAQLITGPAGQGKTRLAYHLCHQLRAQGWVCGLVDHNAPAEVLHRVAFMSTPTLLVLDYSETRCDQLLTLATVLLDRAADMATPVRLLLLARASGEWERPLRTHRDHRVASLFLTLREKPLPPLVPKVLDRRGEFTRALAAFARPLQQTTDDVLAPFDIDHHRYERALDVHAAALACLLDRAADRHEEWRDPIARVLHHEYDYWNRTAATFDLPDPHLHRLDQITTAATLYGATDDDQARVLLSSLRTLEGQPPDVIDRYLRWVQRLYPGPYSLNPLQPDRLGEDHTAATILKEPTVATNPALTASDPQLTQALTILGRAAPRHSYLAATMKNLLASDPTRLIPLGMRVATQLEDPCPLAQALSDTVTDQGHPDTLDIALGALPDQSSALADVAVRTTARALAIHRQLPEHKPALIAYLLTKYATALAAIGKHDEATKAVTEAVEIQRSLALQSADAHQPALAQSLSILSVNLRLLDRHDEALRAITEAVALYRGLAIQLPDVYRPDLAEALNDLANVLGEQGQFDEALVAIAEAVAIYQDLATPLSDA